MIDEPIVYSESALVHINKYDGTDHTYWNVPCNENKAIRKEIREYYRNKQEFHCAYCNRLRQDFNGGQWDIDHIIPKQSHPNHLYTPKNLTVTCKDCNGKKTNKNVLAENVSASPDYPATPDSYIIIHPHFDNYSDNILCRYTADGKIYHEAQTDKGRKTFDMCGLIRFTEMIAGTSEINVETETTQDLTDATTLELNDSFDRLMSEFDELPREFLASFLKRKLVEITGVPFQR